MCGVVERLFRGPADGRLIVRQGRRLAVKLVEHTFDAGCLIEGAAQVGMGPLQLRVRASHDLALGAQRFDCCPGLPVFDRELFHRLAVLLELAARVGHERGRFLGLPHDVRHLGYLRANHLEACKPRIEIRNARDDRCQLLGRVNGSVLDVLDRCRNLGEPAAASVELFEQRLERIPLVTSVEHDRVQFVGTFLRLGAEGQLLEHVRLQSAPKGRRGDETV